MFVGFQMHLSLSLSTEMEKRKKNDVCVLCEFHDQKLNNLFWFTFFSSTLVERIEKRKDIRARKIEKYIGKGGKLINYAKVNEFFFDCAVIRFGCTLSFLNTKLHRKTIEKSVH